MTATDSRRSGSEGMRLYYMIGAFLTWDQSIFTYSRGMGIPTEVPTPIFLIDHPEGRCCSRPACIETCGVGFYPQ